MNIAQWQRGRQARPIHMVGQTLLVVLAGYAHSLSIAWPLGTVTGFIRESGFFVYGQPVWPLQLLSLVVLAAVLQASPPAGNTSAIRPWLRGAWLGGAFATAMLCGTFWWLYISMHQYGGLPALITVLAIFGLAVFLASYTALATAFYVSIRAARPIPPARAAIIFAALWLMAELARVQIFTGFPWGQAGYAHVDGWARPLAGWIGVHGLGWLAAFVAAWLAGLAMQAISTVALPAQRRWALAKMVLIGAATWGLAYGPLPDWQSRSVGVSVPAPGRMAVTLLQGNIPQDEKFEPGSGIATALEWYLAQLSAAKTPLVVAPETAIPLLPNQLPPGYLAALQALFSSNASGISSNRAALFGMPLGSFEEGYANAVVGFKPSLDAANSDVYTYRKHHLVPFGEFIPPGFRWFTNLMNIPLGDFDRGAVGQPSFDWQGQRLAPNICYEDLFGEELAARFIDPALAPTAFVNISNIGWFGDTIAIDQHLHISRMRTLEFDRPMIRATNTGATVVINNQSQVTHALERHTQGALVADFEGKSSMTIYAWWASRLGVWPLWALGLLTMLWAAAGAGWLRRIPRSG